MLVKRLHLHATKLGGTKIIMKTFSIYVIFVCGYGKEARVFECLCELGVSFFFSDCPCVTKILYNLNKFISLDIKCASESCFLMIFADMNVS